MKGAGPAYEPKLRVVPFRISWALPQVWIIDAAQGDTELKDDEENRKERRVKGEEREDEYRVGRALRSAGQWDFVLLFLVQTLTMILVLSDRPGGCNAIISRPRVVPQWQGKRLAKLSLLMLV